MLSRTTLPPALLAQPSPLTASAWATIRRRRLPPVGGLWSFLPPPPARPLMAIRRSHPALQVPVFTPIDYLPYMRYGTLWLVSRTPITVEVYRSWRISVRLGYVIKEYLNFYLLKMFGDRINLKQSKQIKIIYFPQAIRYTFIDGTATVFVITIKKLR